MALTRPMTGVPRERAVARVNLAAIERNARACARELRAGRELCAVVKADGYGHGAVAGRARGAGRRRDAGWRSPTAARGARAARGGHRRAACS